MYFPTASPTSLLITLYHPGCAVVIVQSVTDTNAPVVYSVSVGEEGLLQD
jgi:hypothetical protein